MPSIVGPSVMGGAVQGLTQGMLRGYLLSQQAIRDEEQRIAQEKINALRDLQIGQGQEEAKQRALVQSVVPQIMGAPTAPVELAPAVPSRLIPPPGAALDEEIDRMGPRSVIPGQPAITRPMLTMESLAAQSGIGAQGLAAALASPQGRAALQARSVVTAEQVEQKRKAEMALQNFRERAGESLDKARAGDAPGALLAMIAAAKERVEVDPTAMAHVERLTERYLDLVKNKEEQEAAGHEIQALVRATDKLHNKKDEQSFSELMADLNIVKTKEGRAQAFEIVKQVLAGKVAQIKNAPYVAIYKKALEIQTSLPAGQTMDWPTALAQAMRADPTSFALANAQMHADGKKPPDDWTMALAGTTATKNEWEAGVQAAQAKRLDNKSPAFWAEVARYVKSIKVEPRERTTENLLAAKGQEISQAQEKRRRLKDETDEEEKRVLREDIAQHDRMIRYYDGEILRARGGGTEGAIKGGPGATTPAGGRTGPPPPPERPPWKPEADAPPAKLPSGKPVPAATYKEKADAQALKLKSKSREMLGRELTDAEVIKVMQDKGWKVK